MNYLEVSYISSACGKNKYEPTDKTILILLARSNPKLMKRLLIEDEYIINVDENEKLFLDKTYLKIYFVTTFTEPMSNSV